MSNPGDLSKDIDGILKPSSSTKKCILGKYIVDLLDDDASSLETLLKSTVSHLKVSDLLNRHGFAIGETVIWKHRTEKCSCVKLR